MKSYFDPNLMERHTRRPKHNFAVSPLLWEIQPVCIAPVLPGETMASFTLQSRVVSQQMVSRVVGAWLEYYFFYVTVRQLPDAANILAMFIDPTVTLSPTAASVRSYYDGRGYDFVSQCLQATVQEWFRREGETWSSFVIRANRPAATIGMDTLADSLIDTTVLPDGGAIAGMNVDDLDRARMVLEYRRQLEMMGGDGGQIDYEEVIASYGASLREVKLRDRPKLLRYIRDWTYPTNTVEPTTGTPTTALSWAVNDRATKPCYFKEFGFIFGVQVVRPKVYFDNQTGHGASMMDRAQRWLPPSMDDSGMEKSLAEFTNAQGPFGKSAGGLTNGYWLDVRDLLNYGDQFIDSSTTANQFNRIGLPTIGADARYPTSAFNNDIVVPNDTGLYVDGNVHFQIRTRHVQPS